MARSGGRLLFLPAYSAARQLVLLWQASDSDVEAGSGNPCEGRGVAGASVQSFGMLSHYKMAAASGQVGSWEVEGVVGWLAWWAAVLTDSLSP